MIKRPQKEVKAVVSNVEQKVVGYVTAALGLVAGLAWNEAVRALIDSLYPAGKDTLIAKFTYALVVTVVVVVASFYLSRITRTCDRK